MMKTEERIGEISGRRAKIAEAILNTLNTSSREIEVVWMNEIQYRAKQVADGEAEMIPGEEFEKMRSEKNNSR